MTSVLCIGLRLGEGCGGPTPPARCGGVTSAQWRVPARAGWWYVGGPHGADAGPVREAHDESAAGEPPNGRSAVARADVRAPDSAASGQPPRPGDPPLRALRRCRAEALAIPAPTEWGGPARVAFVRRVLEAAAELELRVCIGELGFDARRPVDRAALALIIGRLEAPVSIAPAR